MTGRDRDIKAHLLATFRVEADEHLEALRSHLLALDDVASPDQAGELVEASFRAMHTLKGAARSVSLLDVERLCQACESVLSTIGRRGLVPARPVLAQLEEAVDGIAGLLAEEGGPVPVGDLVARIERAAVVPAAAAPPPAPAPEPGPRAELPRVPADGTIRLAAAKLDALLHRGEELLSLKLAADDRVHDADALVAEVSSLRRALEYDRSAPLDSELRAVEARARTMLGRLQRDRRTTEAAVDGLLDEARRTRMMPASTILGPFPRMVRDLAGSDGKEAQWTVRGGEHEIDRKVLETIKDPLIHLVRNAVDHGIEPPDEREAAGKPRRGHVSVTFAPVEDGRIEIAVADDGRGIDVERVREAAVRARLLDAERAAALTDEAVLALIYRSGLSTSFVITDVSGHGLGLAIVKERIEGLDGEIRLHNRRGAGTTVRMTMPAAIATFRGLLVKAAGHPFLISVGAVERAIAGGAGETATVRGREAIRVGEEAVPVARLDALLELPPPADRTEPDDERACVVVRGGGARAGLLVDELIGDTEVLVKELGRPLAKVRHVAGAGMLGSGDIVLILRPPDLVAAARERRAPPAPAAAPAPAGPPLVLVVDDALTTRAMERSLLEAAGYSVSVAADGRDAWTALQGERFDLVVSDVDMPRMDGFELTSRIRADSRFADLPVVLVSALESREDKERGIEVGANAYVMKSSFEQSNLLDIIRRLGVKVPAR
jgi:two-component system, chemotaxis family, sensor kinase CheA